MGKSGNKKKKQVPSSSSSSADGPDATVSRKPPSIPAPANNTPPPPPPTPSASKLEQFAAVFLRRAHELKEDGNRRFQSKDYQGAMDRYEQALRLTPRNHPDRAVFHSNRAACLMQMKPVQYECVINECTLALDVHPRFSRALFRRARALEALGKLELALQDVQHLLQLDSNHQDGLELAKRLRVALVGTREEAQQDTQGRSASAPTVSYAGTSPAAVGASVVRGSPVASRGPSLPARPLPKKKGGKLEQPSLKLPTPDVKQNGVSSITSAAVENSEPQTHICRIHPSRAKVLPVEKPSNNRLEPRSGNTSEVPSEKSMESRTASTKKQLPLPTRPLKLVYDHDIRLAQLPLNCRFHNLRALVRKKFPSSKAVLIKYKDLDGDYVTITCTQELRLAEDTALAESARNKAQVADSQKENGDMPASTTVLVPLRLHVVEVPEDQEPIMEEEEEDGGANLSNVNQVLPISEGEAEGDGDVVQGDSDINSKQRCEHGDTPDESNSKEIEIDEWLLDFAQLFRTHIGLDPDAHIDLHELGLEFCTEALEETVTSAEAQPLFEAAACKFQEVAALAFFNWGNVHMCAARKRIPLDETGKKTDFHERLWAAFDWARGQYELARSKYDEALCVKPDFYEGVLALGQESFESAKLCWSLAVSSQVDLSTWDSSETLALFNTAEEKMQLASEMWEKLEDRRMKEVQGSASKRRDVLKSEVRCHRDGHVHHEPTEAEIREQFLVMRTQINLFWGNILFEHSQVEFKLGMPLWKSKLDVAVQKFELAGASPSDIAVVLKNHVSNPGGSCASTGCEHTTDGDTKGQQELQSEEHEVCEGHLVQ